MILISCKGNLKGIDSENENKPSYIDYALPYYDVMIDLWVYDDCPKLGSENALCDIDTKWLSSRSSKLWIRCRNENAMLCCDRFKLHYFWHDNGTYTFTSKGYVWTAAGHQAVANRSILAEPEQIYKEYTIAESMRFTGLCSNVIGLIG